MKYVLSYKEKIILENILSTNHILMENKSIYMINESSFKEILNKVKEYSKKGLLTTSLLTALLSTPGLSQNQKSEISDNGITTSKKSSGYDVVEWEDGTKEYFHNGDIIMKEYPDGGRGYFLYNEYNEVKEDSKGNFSITKPTSYYRGGGSIKYPNGIKINYPPDRNDSSIGIWEFIFEYPDGRKEVYTTYKGKLILHNEFYRVVIGDNCAVIRSDGTKEWYMYGKRHREDGPAIIRPDGTKEWYLNDISYSEEQYDHIVKYGE